MLKINAIILAGFFAYWLPYNAKENDMPKQTPNPVVIDGPYVLYRHDSVFVNYIEDSGGTKSVRMENLPSAAKDAITLQVNTDIPGKTFTVQLKQKLSNEKAEYNGIKKMLVLSDIEGNFGAFRKLLQGNG